MSSFARMPDCHPDRPHQALGMCAPCYNRYWYENGGSVTTQAYQRLRRYQMTLEDFDALFASQRGRCAICDGPLQLDQKRGLCVDHDHGTGRVRGLLCWHCNIALGHLDDDPDRCARAAEYLRDV